MLDLLLCWVIQPACSIALSSVCSTFGTIGCFCADETEMMTLYIVIVRGTINYIHHVVLHFVIGINVNASYIWKLGVNLK